MAQKDPKTAKSMQMREFAAYLTEHGCTIDRKRGEVTRAGVRAKLSLNLARDIRFGAMRDVLDRLGLGSK